MKESKTEILEIIEWHSLARDAIHNFWAVILAGIIAFLGIYIAENSVYTPEYKSEATLVVRAKAASSLAYNNLSASSEMASIYSKVFTQSSMKNLAAENAGYESFDGEISASVHQSTNLLNVEVVSSDPETAYKLLKSVLEIYPEVSDAVFSNSVIDVIVQPEMPVSPSNSISSIRRIEISILVAGAMFALILVLSFLRGTIKNVRLFEKKIDTKLLGTVSHERRPLTLWQKLRGKKRGMLIDTAFASLKFTEDYNHLATKLEYMKRNTGSKVFVVTSVAENEGKSTVSANLALSLMNHGYKVALLDLDLHKPALHKIFKYRKPLKTDFSQVLKGEASPKDFEFLRYKKSQLYLALSKKSCSDVSEWIGSKTVNQCIKSIREKVDFVIIDTPPTSVSADAMSLIKMADKAILVVRTDVVDAADINDTVLTIKNVGGGFAGCLLNDVYKPFTFFGNMGTDDGGYSIYRRSSYRKYKNYSKENASHELLDSDLSE
ncbi:MAG: polysaccharide biosynthesis tyrosine autokinase [Ruminococcaceae bacterium]|nr:polysaccharide biosynthesis tyrosine autokinase [Oscillospiraceae bacterium]